MTFSEHMGKYGIIYMVLALIIGIVIGTFWDTWFPASTTTSTTTQQTVRRGNPFNPNERSKGCSCINGTLSNYGIGSSIPCSQWGNYCENTPN